MDKYRVKHEDQEEGVTLLNAAFRAVGFTINYPDTDLIVRTVKELDRLGGKMSLSDSVKLRENHHKKWDKYFKQKEG